VLFMWVDGVYVKAGLEKEKAALLVIVGGLLVYCLRNSLTISG